MDAEHGETIGSVAGTTDPEAGAVSGGGDSGHRTPVASGLRTQCAHHSRPFHTTAVTSEDWSVNFPLYLYQWNEKLLPLKNMFTTKL